MFKQQWHLPPASDFKPAPKGRRPPCPSVSIKCSSRSGTRFSAKRSHCKRSRLSSALSMQIQRAENAFAPSLIMGQWMVRQQQPDSVGAPQKRFSWAIGLVLALVMLYLVVLKHMIGPINLIICSICLLLLFFEAAFGICIGCKVYKLFNKDRAQLCPGGVCELPANARTPVSLTQVIIVLLFTAWVGAVGLWIYRPEAPRATSTPQASTAAPATPIDPAEAERCKVPDFAKAIGHEEKWKLHNHCLP